MVGLALRDLRVRTSVERRFAARDSESSARTTLAELTPPRIVLWCYLIWWLFTASRYFDPSPRLWLSSQGISGIIGTALYLSTAHAGKTKTTLDRWQVFRLFLMPLCVSSFAALIKDRGFILVFHPTLRANLEVASYCATFGLLVWAAKRFASASARCGAQPRLT